MQKAPQWVKTIYGVVTPSQRLEILRVLNARGPLTYNALKTLAGFRLKEKSGEFAYHLRKLRKQLLVQFDWREKKYTVTNLGRLVLNLTRQIEAQSLVEPGKLYVRTSYQTTEESNVNKTVEAELHKLARRRRIQVSEEFTRALNDYGKNLKRKDVVKDIPLEDHDFILKAIGSEALVSLDPGTTAGRAQFRNFIRRRKVKELCPYTMPPPCELSVAAIVVRNRKSYERYLRNLQVSF